MTNKPNYHPWPQASEFEPTMADAMAAGDGTLHGAIDHWQARALSAESDIAAQSEYGKSRDEMLHNAVALWQARALAAEAKLAASALHHVYRGDCPEAGWPESRDAECPACRAMAAQAAAVPEAHLCIKPACGAACADCSEALTPAQQREYAVLYATLRAQPLDTIDKGGVFAGLVPQNVVLNGTDLDDAVRAGYTRSAANPDWLPHVWVIDAMQRAAAPRPTEPAQPATQAGPGSIWGTLEMACVSAGLAYEADYLDLHIRSGVPEAPLCKEAYDLMSHVFDASYEADHPERACQPCAGPSCGTTTAQHSAECRAEHAAACAPRVRSGSEEVLKRMEREGWISRIENEGKDALRLGAKTLGQGVLEMCADARAAITPQPTAPAAAEPDMRAICEAPGFDPTNHHNAAKCPYCRPAAAPVEAPQPAEPSKDAERLDWVIQQGDEFSLSVISDAPGDGDVQAWGMNHVFGRGVTARDAIDAARAAQAQGEKGAGCTAPK